MEPIETFGNSSVARSGGRLRASPPGAPHTARTASGEELEDIAHPWRSEKRRGQKFDEDSYAQWRFAVGLEPEAALEGAKAERERRREAYWRKQIRTWDIRAWHSTWGRTELEERRRQIAEAYAEVNKPVPEGALESVEEKFGE